MNDNRIRPTVWIAVLGSLAGLALVMFVFSGSQPPPPSKPVEPPEAPPAAEAPPFPNAESRSRADRPSTRSQLADTEPVPYIEGLVWGDIDLREARELMPDNLYWKFGSPTKDPAVLEEREQERRRRNEEYGKVLAGDANEDQVRAYYDYRTALSSDYLEFAEFMSRRFRDTLADEMKGLLDLSIKMHSMRLAQMPAEMETAIERSREHEKIREQWRRQQEEFGSAPAAPAN